jgi:putative hydrolase of the HAD superfamily
MIKTIIFDLNKVIIDINTDDFSYEKAFGISQKEFWKNRAEIFDQYTLGIIEFDDYLSFFLKQANVSLDKLSLAHELHEKGLIPVEGIISLLQELQEKYTLILMAGDGTVSATLKLEKFDLKKYFSKIYISAEQKMRKTNPDYYRLVLKENNLVPEETLFVDDREDYSQAAESVGITALLFSGVPALRKYLGL